MSDIIKIEHLNKCFGDVKAVNDLSFRVKKGELFAFLGVNGAGKSTTISIMCGQLRKDSGNVWIKDKEADRAGSETKRMLGVVFQDSVLDKPLTVKENLKNRAALYGITGNAFEKDWQNWWRYLISEITLTDRLVSCQADREEGLILPERLFTDQRY